MNVRDLIPWGRQTSSNQAPISTGDTRLTPFLGLRREIDRLFDDMVRAPSLVPSPAGGLVGWPSLELAEGEREVRITAEVPGLRENDVDLTVRDGVLSIRGEKKSASEDKDRGYSERWYGRFERHIALPPGTEEDKADASFHDGVLTVTFPRSEGASGRRIPINGQTRH